MNPPLPVYQHPALTVLIDDSQSFLDSVAFQLDQSLACETFVNPQEALDWLRQAYRNCAQEALDPIQVGYDEITDIIERRRAYIELEVIPRIAENAQRFALPAVVVIDHSMPQMSGLEFCEAIRDLPCKKILLTGIANERVAIDAFNLDLIDCYLHKGSPDVVEQLELEVVRLQRKFFEERTHTLKELLTRHSFRFLNDPALGSLVARLRNRYHFVEHYLFPNPAGFVLIDDKGKATLMVIETEESLRVHAELAEDEDAPPELIAALRAHRLVPYFHDTDGRYMARIGDDWLQYCLPSQTFEGRETYYWSLFDLASDRIRIPLYSYAEFLLDFDAGKSI